MTNPAYTKCPKCKAIHQYTVRLPENTPGMEFWSDGFGLSPTRNDVLDFGKCPDCGTFFWIPENITPDSPGLSGIKNMENTWPIDHISNQEFDFIRDFIRSGTAATPEKELLIRIKLWHIINHLIRKYDSQGVFKKITQKIFETAEYKESQNQYHARSTLKQNNLIRLANLIKSDKNEFSNHLLLAETYRELGDFSKSMIFCYKAENAPGVDLNRVKLLKQQIMNKNKMVYKL